MVSAADSSILLDSLGRFESQVELCQERDALVELFCIQIIPLLQTQPLLDPLRNKWRKTYLDLLHQFELSEKQALSEVKQVFSQLEDLCKKGEDVIVKKIAHIHGILSGDPKRGFSSWPLYKVVYLELKELLQMIFEHGGEEICQQYAILGNIQKPRVQHGRKLEIIKEPFIEMYTFAPSVQHMAQVSSLSHWDQLRNPSVVWWYFETVLWCWNTSESYFEKTSALLKKEDENPLPALNEKAAWFEIAGIRNGVQLGHEPVVFTNQFFKEGFRTLINAIMDFAGRGCQIEKQPEDPLNKMIFELQLEENRLWVFAYTGLSEPRKYYLKRFNDGSVEGSGPYEFIKGLLQDHPEGGDVEVKLMKKSDSIPKAIERLGMSESLRGLFFGQSRGTRVTFKGSRVAIDRNEKCRNLLKELGDLHERAGSPEYIKSQFSLESP